MTTVSSADSLTHPRFLSGGGETGRILRAFAWEETSLGAPSGWPPALRVAVRLVLNSTIPSCLIWGPERIAFWNDAYRDLLEAADPGRGLGRPAAEGLVAFWPEIAPHIERVLGGEDAPGSDFAADRINAQGGRDPGRWICKYAPVDDESAAYGIAGVIKTCAWVPGHQQSLESRLAESQDQLALALAGRRSIGAWDWDLHSGRIFADEAFARAYGVDPEAAKSGAPIAQFFAAIHPEDLDRIQKQVERAVQTGDAYREEYRLVTPVEKVRWLIAEGRCHRGADGTPTHFKGIAFDITERKRMEQELLELNTDLESKVAARASERGRTWQVSPDLLGVLNLQGYFEASNPAWQTTLGWSEAEVASTVFFDFIHPEDLGKTKQAWEDATARGLPALQFENRYVRKDGSYCWLSWVAVPESDKVYCSARDITEDKERAEALKIAEGSLRQSQKMEAVGQLTGGLAHDFNNLLTTINGSLELIERSVAAGQLEKLDRLLTMSRGAVKRAAALTHRLLAFSRLQTLAPRAVDVNRLTADMEDLIRRTVGPQVRLTFIGAAGLWPALVDPGQLENALLNLCINARDAMPDGGQLTIETANEVLDDRGAKERDLPPGPYLSLCVTDTGVGMPDDVIAKAFDPFYTTKPLGSGTGLGLSMVYGFARQSGGQVRIRSEIGKGTTMSIYLPRHDGEMDPELIDSLALDQPAGDGEVLLVIDDEPTIRTLLVELLRESGYQVLEAPDGPTGLRMLQNTGRVDLLITDVGLPGGMNGRQVADAARASRPELKVLFITGYAENAVVGNGHIDRWMSVLTKPFELQALTHKVKDILSA